MKKIQLSDKATFMFLLITLMLFSIASVCPAASDYWPTEQWKKSTPEEQGMHSEKLADMMETIRKEKYAIDSITVIRNGYIVLDAYFHPFKSDTEHVIHSCTKSITSTLVGIAIDKGLIKDVNQPVLDFFPEYTPEELNADKQAMTIEHLLTMASGLKCRDSYLYKWKGLWELEQSPDWVKHMLDLPMAEPPGTRFEYCNGVSFLLTAILQKAAGMKAMDFAKQHLFTPLGIKEVKWQSSPKGIDIGWGKMKLKPHDMGKIGLLFLNKGRWEDKQIVSEKWVEAATKKQISSKVMGGYGYQWWVHPSGIYTAVGYNGQFILVVPSQNMTIVFTSDLDENDIFIPFKLLDQYIIPSIASSEPLGPDPSQIARLASIIDSCAAGPIEGFTWLSKAEGTAQNGEFIRMASPSFKFSYPKGSKKEALQGPHMIMQMKTPEGVSFSASIVDKPQDMALSDIGPFYLAGILHSIGSNVQVVSNEEIKLKDGTTAYRTNIKWVYQKSIPLFSQFLTVFKDDKCVYLAAHPMNPMPETEKIVESIVLK